MNISKIAERILGITEAKFSEPTYRCHLCQDRGYILWTDTKGYSFGKPCSDCLAGLAILQGYREEDDAGKLRRVKEHARARTRAEDFHQVALLPDKEDEPEQDDIPF